MLDQTKASQLAQHYLNANELNAYLGVKMQVKPQPILETPTHWIFDYLASSHYEEQARYPKSPGVSVHKTTGKVEMIYSVGKGRRTNLALYRAAQENRCILWFYAGILAGYEILGFIIRVLLKRGSKA